MAEYSNVYQNEDGVKVELKIKAECSSDEDMRKALAFMAQSSRRFYLETATRISSTL